MTILYLLTSGEFQRFIVFQGRRFSSLIWDELVGIILLFHSALVVMWQVLFNSARRFAVYHGACSLGMVLNHLSIAFLKTSVLQSFVSLMSCGGRLKCVASDTKTSFSEFADSACRVVQGWNCTLSSTNRDLFTKSLVLGFLAHAMT